MINIFFTSLTYIHQFMHQSTERRPSVLPDWCTKRPDKREQERSLKKKVQKKRYWEVTKTMESTFKPYISTRQIYCIPPPCTEEKGQKKRKKLVRNVPQGQPQNLTYDLKSLTWWFFSLILLSYFFSLPPTLRPSPLPSVPWTLPDHGNRPTWSRWDSSLPLQGWHRTLATIPNKGKPHNHTEQNKMNNKTASYVHRQLDLAGLGEKKASWCPTLNLTDCHVWLIC